MKGSAVRIRASASVFKRLSDLNILGRLLAEMPVLLDLSGVRVLTSAGVVALLTERSFGRRGLYCSDGSVAARLLEIVQAQRLVPIYRDLTAALAGSGVAA